MIINFDYFIECINKLEQLFRIAFGKEVQPGFLHWRYIQNPQKTLLMNVEKYNGEIVANYSVSPTRLSLRSSFINAALSMTTMTHPDFERKGLFTKLGGKMQF